MSLLVIGINHNTASLDLREKMAFGPERLPEALDRLEHEVGIPGTVIVSTCNRTELYCNTIPSNKSTLMNWLSEYGQVESIDLKPSLYQYEGQAAMHHLIRVACGLDSQVLGEPQILGQVKKAYFDSKELHDVDPIVERSFQKAFSVAKRVRTETDIGEHAVSVAYAACILARHIFESLLDATVLLIGAGETIELVAKHLVGNGCHQLIVANRTRERAMKLADRFSAEVISLQEIPDHLARADIVISSTASPLPIIGKGLVESAIKQRRYQPMLFVDIAVPRDIESQVSEIRDVYLYSVDDLQSIVDNNIEQRKAEAVQAEAIIDEEVSAFSNKIRSLQAVDSIREYRNMANQIQEALLEKSLHALASGADPEKVMRELSHKLTNKLIHSPTRALQHAAEQGEPAAIAVIRQSLGLDDLI